MWRKEKATRCKASAKFSFISDCIKFLRVQLLIAMHEMTQHPLHNTTKPRERSHIIYL